MNKNNRKEAIKLLEQINHHRFRGRISLNDLEQLGTIADGLKCPSQKDVDDARNKASNIMRKYGRELSDQ